MSKSILSIFFISIFMFNSCNNKPDQLSILNDHLNNNFKNSIEIIDNRINELIYKSGNMSYSKIDTNSVYNSISRISKLVNKSFNQLSTFSDTLQTKNWNEKDLIIEIRKMDKVLFNLNNSLDSVIFNYFNIFVKKHNSNYNPKDYQYSIERIHLKSKFYKKDLIYNSIKSLGIGNIGIIIKTIKSDIKNSQFYLTDYLTKFLRAGIGCSFGHKPVIMPKKSCIKKGEIFEAEIALFPFFYDTPLENVILYIDNVPYKYSKESGIYITYKSKPILTKSKIISFSTKIKNPITNKWDYYLKDYLYEITTK